MKLNDTTGKQLASINQLKAVLDYVRSHYTEPVTLKELADIACMSPTYFCRYFHQEMGKTPFAFLNEYRLNAAAEALHATDETVLTIASRCGFENLSYFNRAFKAHFGMTPREYRKK